MSAIVNKGTGYAISANTVSNNTNTGSNIPTWQVVNVSGQTAAVNVYTSNTNVTMTTGVVVANGSAAIVTGDFGSAYSGNVWVSAILDAGSGTVYATPVREIQ